MGKVLDKLESALAGVKKKSPEIGAIVQNITTQVDTLDAQLQQMQAQKPANQTELHNAANTVQALKGQVQSLVSALQQPASKSTAAASPPATSSTPTSSSGGS
jgi:ABC-type transporter Mla subunit MlaD